MPPDPLKLSHAFASPLPPPPKKMKVWLRHYKQSCGFAKAKKATKFCLTVTHIEDINFPRDFYSELNKLEKSP